MEIGWVAVTSTGDILSEHTGEYKVIEGQLKPWVRLVNFLIDNNQTLVSLSLNCDGKQIHLPIKPLYYSLEYRCEAEGIGGDLTQTFLVVAIAHFKEYEIQYIQALDGDGWIEITKDHKPLLPTPEN